MKNRRKREEEKKEDNMLYVGMWRLFMLHLGQRGLSFI